MTGSDLADLWENAPSGHLVVDPLGVILRANTTLLDWLHYDRDALCGRAITDLFTAGGRMHFATHFAPMLRMNGTLEGVTVDMVAADGTRLPMFMTANIKTGIDGEPELARITVVEAADRRAYERELLDERRRAESESARARAFADTLRRSLLPPVLDPPPGMEAADHYFAASPDDVGGDFYDLFPLSRDTWGFFLGDVVGKGVDAAVVTGLTRYVLRSAAVSDENPVRVLHNLNSVLLQRLGIQRNRLCTLIYGNMVQRGDGFDVELASGGHPPPLLLGGDGSACYADTVGGIAVGVTTTPKFVTSRLHLSPGDTLILYTDGLTEASIGIGRERYDDEGALLQFATQHAPASASTIVGAIRDLLDSLGSGVQDDAAVLAFGVPPR